ncbi:hypothetical protein F3Y22_tig00002237pilonHSYRG00069 [Hibiscus syriacus]|uniref:Uncharacterized protein n=1 Tax=Hibiscus syriacus TaxID=106335 RepID=A0A6A3CU61_HIBSY|nr:hypothetical protein F3Y22_tig00002237pilonHSYRG00069 [Hibiscus syriacus]
MLLDAYKWAEVLAADAFSAFEDAGLEDNKILVCVLLYYRMSKHVIECRSSSAVAVKETGRKFLETILTLGGGKAQMESEIFSSMVKSVVDLFGLNIQKLPKRETSIKGWEEERSCDRGNHFRRHREGCCMMSFASRGNGCSCSISLPLLLPPPSIHFCFPEATVVQISTSKRVSPGRLRIRVSDEFIRELMEESKMKDGVEESCSSRVCTMPQLPKQYALLGEIHSGRRSPCLPGDLLRRMGFPGRLHVLCKSPTPQHMSPCTPSDLIGHQAVPATKLATKLNPAHWRPNLTMLPCAFVAAIIEFTPFVRTSNSPLKPTRKIFKTIFQVAGSAWRPCRSLGVHGDLCWGVGECMATFVGCWGRAWHMQTSIISVQLAGKPWRRSRSPGRHCDLRPHCGFHPISANNMGSALSRELFILKALYRLLQWRKGNRGVLRVRERRGITVKVRLEKRDEALGIKRKASSCRYMVAFHYGSTVLFNIKDHEVKSHLEMGGPDYIVLKALDIDSIRDIESVLGRSIALDYFVSRVDGMVEGFADINGAMKRLQLSQWIGQASLNLLEKPIQIWLTLLVRYYMSWLSRRETGPPPNVTPQLSCHSKIFLLKSEIAWREARHAQIYEYLREEYEVTNALGIWISS